MEMEMEMEIKMTCPECNVIFNYYDFLSHSNTNSCSYETYETYEMNNNNNQTMMNTYTYNGMNDYGNYLGNGNLPAVNNNLYNPMLNRRFQDYTNTLTTTDILTNSLLNININCGIDKYKLLTYSKFIQCSERTDCPICLCSYPEETSFYKMNCNHSFCIECCEQWFSTNSFCPLCRMNYN